MLELRCAERHEMKYISMSCVAVSCTWCTVLRLRNVYSIEPAWCSLYYRSDMQEQKARWSVLVWQRNGLLKDSSPPLFFSCVFLGGLWTHGKVNSLWGHSSCLATEKKHFCLNFFKCSRVPVSALAHVSRSERADAAHITSSLVLTSRFFSTLTLFFLTAPTDSSRLSWGACETGAQTEQKQEVKGHTFSVVRLIRQVYLEGTETRRAFFQQGPAQTHPFLRFKGVAKAGTWAKLSGRVITAQ